MHKVSLCCCSSSLKLHELQTPMHLRMQQANAVRHSDFNTCWWRQLNRDYIHDEGGWLLSQETQLSHSCLDRKQFRHWCISKLWRHLLAIFSNAPVAIKALFVPRSTPRVDAHTAHAWHILPDHHSKPISMIIPSVWLHLHGKILSPGNDAKIQQFSIVSVIAMTTSLQKVIHLSMVVWSNFDSHLKRTLAHVSVLLQKSKSRVWWAQMLCW